MAELQLAIIDVQPGAALESQSGLQMLRPRIYGAWAPAGGPEEDGGDRTRTRRLG